MDVDAFCERILWARAEEAMERIYEDCGGEDEEEDGDGQEEGGDGVGDG